MKIDSYNLNLSSSRVYEEQKQESEVLREWGKRKDVKAMPEASLDKSRSPRTVDHVNISSEARSMRSLSVEQASVQSSKDTGQVLSDEEQGFDSRLMTLKRLIESITGREIKLTHVDSSAPEAATTPENTEVPEEQPRSEQAPREQEWGMSYSHYQSHYESEQTSFSASGIVKTADGQEITFAVDLEMSREYFSEERLEITAGAAKIDPLVINYAGTAAELQDVRFEFDLTMDGEKELIHRLAPGSGFLVFDKNSDGVANDGSELFGPSTGDGFEELAAYDEDGNNWIDENDSIYEKLSLWHQENGADTLQSLKSANVGAIYLGNADTSFDLNNESNDTQAQIRKTGVYLKDSGGVGTVQQVDFTA